MKTVCAFLAALLLVGTLSAQDTATSAWRHQQHRERVVAVQVRLRFLCCRRDQLQQSQPNPQVMAELAAIRAELARQGAMLDQLLRQQPVPQPVPQPTPAPIVIVQPGPTPGPIVAAPPGYSPYPDAPRYAPQLIGDPRYAPILQGDPRYSPIIAAPPLYAPPVISDPRYLPPVDMGPRYSPPVTPLPVPVTPYAVPVAPPMTAPIAPAPPMLIAPSPTAPRYSPPITSMPMGPALVDAGTPGGFMYYSTARHSLFRPER